MKTGNVSKPASSRLRPAKSALLLLLMVPGTLLGQIAAPTITLQPGNVVVPEGFGAGFTVSASGTAPLSYQWRLEGSELAGATNRSFFLRAAQRTNTGAYSVVVTNVAGAVTSRVAQLSVGIGRSYVNARGMRLPYRIFVPGPYDPAQKYPLVLFWHGAGESGKDNLLQLKDQGQYVFLSAVNQAQYPCFFLSPQLPFPVGCGSDFEDETVELLKALETEFSIDPERLYVTGLSMGGYISWNLIARYPDMFAAAAPMSSGWSCPIEDLYLSIRTPVWNFHAADDSTVPIWFSDYAVGPLRAAGGNPIYTRYESGGHAIWAKAYSTPPLVDWFMAQRRGQRSTTPPLVTISSPTVDAAFTTRSPVVDLAGTATLNLSNVLAVTWTNTLTGTGGLAAGSNDWSARAIPLQPAVTNLILITGRGTSYAPEYGGNTTFNDTLAVLFRPNRPPVPRIAVSPLAEFPALTNLVIISPNGLNALLLLDGSGSTDPDLDPLQFEWQEGSQSIGTGVMLSHLFPTGRHTITLLVSDGKAVATTSVTLEVITPSESLHILEAMTEESDLLRNREHPLLATLRTAGAAFDRRDFVAGLNELDAFENKVQAQVLPRKAELAAALMRSAEIIIHALLSQGRPNPAATIQRPSGFDSQ